MNIPSCTINNTFEMIAFVFTKNSFTFSFYKIRLFIDSVQKIYHCREICSLFITVWWIKMQPTYLNLQSRHCTCSTMMFLRRKGFKSFCIFLKSASLFPLLFWPRSFFVSVENEIEIAKSLQQDLTMGKEKICISFRRFCKYMRTMAHFDS